MAHVLLETVDLTPYGDLVIGAEQARVVNAEAKPDVEGDGHEVDVEHGFSILPMSSKYSRHFFNVSLWTTC